MNHSGPFPTTLLGDVLLHRLAVYSITDQMTEEELRTTILGNLVRAVCRDTIILCPQAIGESFESGNPAIRKSTKENAMERLRTNFGITDRTDTSAMSLIQFYEHVHWLVVKKIQNDGEENTVFKPGDNVVVTSLARVKMRHSSRWVNGELEPGREGEICCLLPGNRCMIEVKDKRYTNTESWEIDKAHLRRISLREQANIAGGIEKLAARITREILNFACEKESESNYLATSYPETMLRQNSARLIRELLQDGLYVELRPGVYAMNIDRVLEILRPRLAQTYANPEFYSSPDMFSPPAERRPHSIRFELTTGCDHNHCTFCGGYKQVPFTEKSFSEFTAHLEQVRAALGGYFGSVSRVFLGGANALGANLETLLQVLGLLKNELPDLTRIALYGRADSIAEKGDVGMHALKAAGLNMIYCGFETGSDELLSYVRKRTSFEQMRIAGEIANATGIDLSVMLMPGLGGVRFYEDHIQATVALLNAVQTRFITFMAVNPAPNSVYTRTMTAEIAAGTNRPLTDTEVAEQTKEILTRMEPRESTVAAFRSGVDRVGMNPFGFRVKFDAEGKKTAIAACVESRRLRKVA